MKCQICSKTNHETQNCFFRFNRDNGRQRPNDQAGNSRTANVSRVFTVNSSKDRSSFSEDDNVHETGDRSVRRVTFDCNVKTHVVPRLSDNVYLLITLNVLEIQVLTILCMTVSK